MASQRSNGWSENVRLSLIGITLFIGCWYLAVFFEITPRRFLPAPHEVLFQFARLIQEPFTGFTLGQHLLSSFRRFLNGFLLAIAIGIPLGLLMALSRGVQLLVTPVLKAFVLLRRLPGCHSQRCGLVPASVDPHWSFLWAHFRPY